MALKTRKPTGKAPWPFLLIAGAEKAGKSYAAAQASSSDKIDRTFWIEVGEGAADQYGSLGRYEIVEHDGTAKAIHQAIHDASAIKSEKPNLIVIDSMTELWDLFVDEQQQIANQRKNKDDAAITMDQWNVAKKRWRSIIDALRAHTGPVIVTARLEQVVMMDEKGKPTTDKTWKVRAEKNLPFEVDAIVEIPRPRKVFLTGVRSLRLEIKPGGHEPFPDFTVDALWDKLELTDTAPRNYVAPDSKGGGADLGTVPSHDGAAADLIAEIEVAATVEQVRALWTRSKAEPWFTADVQQALTARASELSQAEADGEAA
jgi:hypothetical protein